MWAGFKSLLYGILSVTTFSWSSSSLDQINNKLNQVFPIVENPCGADMDTLAMQFLFLLPILAPSSHFFSTS